MREREREREREKLESDNHSTTPIGWLHSHRMA